MSSSENSIRLQKFIAEYGICSRRKAEELILDGKIKVNGRIECTLGTKVDPSTDIVEYEGSILNIDYKEKIYVLLNKPRGVMTTVSDPEGRPTVMDYCKGIKERIFPVGRLDYYSEGLLILTNDGEVAHMIQHPSFKVTKVYEVKIFGLVNESIINKMRQGISYHGEFLKPLSVRIVGHLEKKTWIEVRLQEGKNREIRKICSALGLTIDKLRRVAIENLTIQDMAPGSFDFLSKKELLAKLGIDSKGEKKTLSKTFVSNKKGISTRKYAKKLFRREDSVFADDKRFYKFRKEHYQQTIEFFNQKKTNPPKPVSYPAE